MSEVRVLLSSPRTFVSSSLEEGCSSVLFKKWNTKYMAGKLVRCQTRLENDGRCESRGVRVLSLSPPIEDIGRLNHIKVTVYAIFRLRQQMQGENYFRVQKWDCGAMGAQLLCKQKVGGSSPLSSTNYTPLTQLGECFFYKEKVEGSSPSWRAKYALVIQLNRISSYELESQEFESSLAHQYIGTQFSLVERSAWDRGVAGSNPVVPTISSVFRN